VMHDPSALRLEANIAERCTGELVIGVPLAVRFGTPAKEIPARVDEIAPMADPQTRTLLIKAALPADSDLRPGTFATVSVPCGTHRALLVPQAAVRRAGQLETVRIVTDGETRLRDVRTGKTYGDDVEILSGLQPGEAVLIGP
jgi:multidrug efflux pump subunit AcrA (membrane-fusion protein)